MYRDGQGSVADYVQYFKQPAFDGEQGRQEAESRGLLARATGKRAYTIARSGTPELIAAHRVEAIKDEAAVAIAQAAPNDKRLQALGMKMVQAGKPIHAAANSMRAVKAMGGDTVATGDMFGFDDSAIKEAEAMARVASAKQRELSEQIAAVQGAAKRPAQAKKLGVDVKDPEGVKKRIVELKAELAEWENWASDPALVQQVRAELDLAPLPTQEPAPEPEPPVDDVTGQMFSRAQKDDATSDMFGQAGPERRQTDQVPMPEQTGMFAEPTTGERVRAATEAKDAKRNGRTGGREDTEAGLLDGQRPEQVRLSVRQDAALDFGNRSVDQLAAEYADLPKTEGGQVIDTDLVRELSPEYRADRTLSPAIHKAASDLTKKLFSRALARPVAEGRDAVVRFMAGGGGSGKSTAANDLLGTNNADIVYDGTLSNMERAFRDVDAALASKRKVEIVYVYRSPANSAESAIGRAIKARRPVPVDVLAEAHTNAPEVVKALLARYDGNEDVSVLLIDNNGPKESVHFMSPEDIPDVNESQARQVFLEAVEQARQDGRLDQPLLEGFLGSSRSEQTAAMGQGRTREPERGVEAGNRDPVTPKPSQTAPSPSNAGLSISAAEQAAKQGLRNGISVDDMREVQSMYDPSSGLEALQPLGNRVRYKHGEEILQHGLEQWRAETGLDDRAGPRLGPREWAEPSEYEVEPRGEGTYVSERSSPEVVQAESDRLIQAAKDSGFFWGGRHRSQNCRQSSPAQTRRRCRA